MDGADPGGKLPNRLVIRFAAWTRIDGVAG